MLLQFEQLSVVNLASLVRAHALEHADEVYRTPVGQLASRHWSTAHEDGGDVDAQACHEHPWHDLVAVGDAHHTVEAVRLNHSFDTICYQLAAG